MDKLPGILSNLALDVSIVAAILFLFAVGLAARHVRKLKRQKQSREG